MKFKKAKYSEEFCTHCEKWFYEIGNRCPDSYMHEELGLKCCHFMDPPLPKPSSSHNRKRRKRLEDKIKKSII
jgi:hypothetical protein